MHAQQSSEPVVRQRARETRRLCVVVPAHWEAFIGGAQYQAKWIVEEAAKSGDFEIYYLARRVSQKVRFETHEVVQIGRSEGIRRYGLFLDAPQLWRMLDRIRPDVIYQRVGGGYTGVCARYARKRGVRMIWHIAHDSDVTREGLGKWWNKPHRAVEKLFLEYGLRRADAVIAQTQHQAQLLRDNYGIDACAVIPNSHPGPQECIEKRTPPLVVWVANWKAEKQPELFVDLAEDLATSTDAKFLMAGSLGATNLDYSGLVARASRLPNLEYLGGIPQDEVNALLAKADVFVNTSRGEGFANTFIQAWMREVPVVSLSVDPDSLLAGGGLGYCSGSYDKLREDVYKLVSNGTLRREMGSRCAQYAMANHSLKNVRRILELM